MDSLRLKPIFSLLVQMYRKSCCTTPGISIGAGSIGMDRMLKFYVKVFIVMGKALSGELSCMQTGLVVGALDVQQVHKSA